MRTISLEIPDVLLIESERYSDERGWFSVTYNKAAYTAKGVPFEIVQENRSLSTKPNTVRGLHFQLPPKAQAKLIEVISGRILDIAVDLRKGSRSFRHHVAVELAEKSGQKLYIPRGFAHGFITRGPNTLVSYKVDNDYAPELERGIRWNDPDLGIAWGEPLDEATVSSKDRNLPPLCEVDVPFSIGSFAL